MRLFARVGPELSKDPSGAVAESVAEFQERWREALELPAGVRRHKVAADPLAERVTRLFPRMPARWGKARRHSIDIMVAASSAEGVNRGDFQLVLAQLHVAANALATRALVEQHEEPARLLAAEEADHGGSRVYAIPPTYVNVSSRVSPPSALLSSRYTYVSLGMESVVAPPGSRTLAADDLLVDRRGDRLVVHHPKGSDEFDFFEVIAENLSGAVQRLFRPMAPAPHTPVSPLVDW